MSLIYRTRDTSSGDILSIYSENMSSISIKKIKDYINQSVIRPRFRLHWLNPDETTKITLPEQDILGGSFSENYQNGQRRSLSVELYNEDGRYTPNVNGIWQDVKFSFDVGLELEDNQVIWFPKGIFYIINATVSHSVGVKSVNIEMGDKFSVLDGAMGTLDSSYIIPSSVQIYKIVNDILRTPKGNGDVLDPKPVIFDSSLMNKTTQAEIKKESGDNFGSIILDLATQLSAEVFYDTEGCLNFVSINDVTNDVNKPVVFQIYDYYGDFSQNNLNLKLNEVINRIIVIGSNIKDGVVMAIAVNDKAESPLCYQRIGYRTAPPINDTNITSDILAQERADYELRNKLILKSSISVNTIFNPLLTVNNLIGVTDGYYEMEQEKFLIQSISFSLNDASQMSIDCSNIINLPFLV